MAIDLTTLAEVKTWLDISGTSKDTRITQLIPYVSRRIERWLGRPDGFELRSRVELIDEVPFIPDGQVWGYSCNVSPITSVASILTDEDHDFTTSPTTLVEDTDFVVHLAQGRIEFDGTRPPEGENSTQITYTAGLAATTSALLALDEHADLVMAATMQVGYVLDRRNSPGSTSESVGGKTKAEPALNLLPEVRELLHPWRRVKVS